MSRARAPPAFVLTALARPELAELEARRETFHVEHEDSVAELHQIRTQVPFAGDTATASGT